MSQFSNNRRSSILAYAEFVNNGIGISSPLHDVKNQVFLGSDAFVERCLNKLEHSADLSEIPKLQRRMLPLPLKQYAINYPTRNQAITKAYSSGGYTMKEIIAHFGISYFMVSKIVRDSRFTIHDSRRDICNFD